MPDDPTFAEWLARVRGGDAVAATELVRRYESAVRVAVRLRLTDPRLRRHLDSMDICQSVMASFFVRAAAGQYDLDSPAQLVGLLVAMAQNKVKMQHRRHHQQSRDVKRTVAPTADTPPVPATEAGPARQAEARDLLAAVFAQFTEGEREVARRRGDGQTWVEIAAALGETPQAVRMRLTRAVDRVAGEFGGDDTDA